MDVDNKVRKKSPNYKRIALPLLVVMMTGTTSYAQNQLPNLPAGATMEDLISDSGFEFSDAGFGASAPNHISLSDNAIFGSKSLQIDFPAWQRLTSYKDFAWGQGPLADSLTAKAIIEVDQASHPNHHLLACSVGYLQSGSRVESCREIPTVPGSYRLYQELHLDAQQLSRATIEFRYPFSGNLSARIDGASLYVVRPETEAEQLVPDTSDNEQLVDLIQAPGFEQSSHGFTSAVPDDIALTSNAIQESQSLALRLQDYRRVQYIHDWDWNQGPIARSLTLAGKLRIDATTSLEAYIHACAVAYLHNDNTRYETCQLVSSAEEDLVQLHTVLQLDARQIRRAFYELRYPGSGAVNAVLDDAHLYLVTALQPESGDEGTGDTAGGAPQPGNAAPDPRQPLVPEGGSLLELIEDSGFEHSMAGFSSPVDKVLSVSGDAIFGQQSLHLDFTNAPWTRISSGFQWGWNAGPLASKLAIKAKALVPQHYQTQATACAIAYLFNGNRLEQCQYLAGHQDYQDIYQEFDLGNQQVDRVFFELRHPNSGVFSLTLDDAHLYLVTANTGATSPGTGDGGNGDDGNGEGGDGDNPDSGNGDNGSPNIPGYSADSDLELVGFHSNPSNYRSIASNITRNNDVSARGQAANNSAKRIPVALHPSADAVASGMTTVSFGLPLAPGSIVNSQDIKVLDSNGNEIPAHVSSLLDWQQMPTQSLLCDGLLAQGNPGIRSVLIQFSMAFNSNSTENVTVVLNEGQRSLDVTEKQDPRTLFRTVNDGTYAQDINSSGLTIQEPNVIAAIDHEYLICSGLNVLSNASGSRAYLAKTDTAQEDFFYSSINQHRARQDWEVTDPRDHIDYFTFTPAWLYGRPQTFYNGYIRSGNVDMLREAMRATDHYAQNIWTPEDCADAFYPYCVGSFKLKNPNPNASWQDMKYSNSRPLLTHYLLTGDETWLDKIGYIAWGMEYHVDLEGNTETARHRAYALDAHNVDYALTGNGHQLGKISNGIAAMLLRQQNGVAGYGSNGCFNYSPEGGDVPNFSPWMLNLLTNVMLTTYQETGITGIPQSLVKVAQCEIDRAIVQLQPGENGPMPVGGYYPFYIASSFGEKQDLDGFNPYNGFEHAIDVATVVALGAYFAEDPIIQAEFVGIAKALLETHGHSIDNWTRETLGRAKYRLAPPRKYNWQYKHAGVLGWALGNDTGGTGKASY